MFLEAVELLIEEDTRAVQYCSASLCSIGGAGCTVLYCTVLQCIPLQYRRCWLYCTVLYCTVQYCIVVQCCSIGGAGCPLLHYLLGGVETQDIAPLNRGLDVAVLSPRAAAVLALIITLLLSVLARY